MAEWSSSWLAEQEDRGSIPRLATWIFRDWLSPASKSRYGWKIAKSTLIKNNQTKLEHDFLTQKWKWVLLRPMVVRVKYHCCMIKNVGGIVLKWCEVQTSSFDFDLLIPKSNEVFSSWAKIIKVCQKIVELKCGNINWVKVYHKVVW